MAYLSDKASDLASLQTVTYAAEALSDFWGEKTISEVTPESCKAYMKARRRSVATVRRELSTLRAAIGHDFKEGRLTAVVPVWLPPQPDTKDVWITRKQFAALLRASRKDPRARGHLPLFMLLAIYTGARKEAILSLRWPQVDLDRRLIDFNPPGRARTKKGRPIVPISPRLMTVLRAAWKRGTDLGYVIHRDQKRIANIQHGFASAACNAGMGTWRERPYHRKKAAPGCLQAKTYIERVPVTDITPHVLRHSSASWMAQDGVPFPVIARFLGHADSRTTEAIYSHFAPEYLQDAVDALGGRNRVRNPQNRSRKHPTKQD